MLFRSELLNLWEKSLFSSRVNELTSLDNNIQKKNTLTREPVNLETGLTVENAKHFLKVLSPFAPFITEEIWQNVLGEKGSIHQEPWPKVDERANITSNITLPVQINGKVRDTIQVLVADSQEEIIRKALKKEKIAKYLPVGKYKKVIYVKGKIMNFIV